MKTYVSKPVLGAVAVLMVAGGIVGGLAASGTFSSGLTVYSPPSSFPATTPTGLVNYPIDADGCQDGVDSTVAMENWLYSLPQGTIANPTIINFPQSACYVINGTLYLYGFENFQLNFGRFEQHTVLAGPETRACTLNGANGYGGAPHPNPHYCQGSTAPACWYGPDSHMKTATQCVNEQNGLYTNPLPQRQVLCALNGTGPRPSGGYTDPSNADHGGSGPGNGTEPTTNQDNGAGTPDLVLMWFWEGGCNIVMNDMTIIGGNFKGATVGGTSGLQQDTLITTAGTQFVTITNSLIDDPYGDCITSQGLHEAPGTGGGYPDRNITAINDLCANAGRDDMTIIAAENVNYSHDVEYQSSASIFDIETDQACQDGTENDEIFDFNTILQNPNFPSRLATLLSGQTDSTTQRIDFSHNTLGPTVQMRVVMNQREQYNPQNPSASGCLQQPAPPGSDFTIADNTWTAVNTGGGGFPEPFADLGVSPLYVYGNNGPMGATSNVYVIVANANFTTTMYASVDNNTIGGAGYLNSLGAIAYAQAALVGCTTANADCAYSGVNGGQSNGDGTVTLDHANNVGTNYPGGIIPVGTVIKVANVTGFNPNGPQTVTASTQTSVTFTSAATGTWTSGGSIAYPPPSGSGVEFTAHCGNTGSAITPVGPDTTCGGSSCPSATPDGSPCPVSPTVAALPVGYSLPPAQVLQIGTIPDL